MDVDKEVRLLNVWVENCGGQFDQDKVKIFENKYLNELTKGTISDKFPKNVYALLHLRAENIAVEMTGEETNKRKDIFELIFSIGFSLYIASATHIVVGVGVFILLICWAFIKYMRNRKRILKEQIIAFNEHYAIPAPSFSYKKQQNQEQQNANKSRSNSYNDDDFSFKKEKFNDPEEGRFNDDRFESPRYKAKYEAMLKGYKEPTGDPSEQGKQYTFIRQADLGKQKGIKPWKPKNLD